MAPFNIHNYSQNRDSVSNVTRFRGVRAGTIHRPPFTIYCAASIESASATWYAVSRVLGRTRRHDSPLLGIQSVSYTTMTYSEFFHPFLESAFVLTYSFKV